MADESHNPDDIFDGAVWDPEFKCYRVNGFLFPKPINSAPAKLASPSPSPPRSPLSRAPPQTPSKVVKGNHPPPGDASSSSKINKRELKTTTVIDNNEVSFRLLKCQKEDEENRNIKEYILEKREVAKNCITYHILRPTFKDGKHKLEAKQFNLGGRVLLPVMEVVNPPVQSESKLSLIERLSGKWTIQTRQRNLRSLKTDKFFYHEKVNKNLRSLNEAAVFIVYGVIY